MVVVARNPRIHVLPSLSVRGIGRHAGFTQIELVVVLVIVGILAAVVIPRFSGRAGFDARGFSDRVTSSLQFAQNTAIAQRRNVCVAVGGNTVGLSKAPSSGAGVACNTALVDPTTGAAFSIAAPANVTVSASVSPITFDALGQSVDAGGSPVSADATVTVASSDASFTSTVTVEKYTGYVH